MADGEAGVDGDEPETEGSAGAARERTETAEVRTDGTDCSTGS